MRLALNGWFYNLPYTGTGLYLRELLNHFPNDLEVIIVTPDEAQPTSRAALHTAPAARSSFGKVYFEQVAFPKACSNLKVDLAHIPHWAPPFNSPVPFIVTIHDVIPLILPDYNRALKQRGYNAIVSAASQGATHIITVSQSAKQDIVKHLNIPPEKISVTYEAASPDHFPRLGALVDIATRQKYNLPDSYVLYLGGFDPRKNVKQLLSAWTWASAPIGDQYPLVIAGKLPQPGDRFYFDFVEHAKEIGIADTVKFIGAVDEEDKAAIYRGAACFVFPSSYEGFGLPPLEAMACGAPVITTAFSSLPEIVGEAAYLIQDPNDTRALGAAIISVIVNDDLSQRLINDGLIQAKKFSWQKTADETVAIYKQVIGQ